MEIRIRHDCLAAPRLHVGWSRQTLQNHIRSIQFTAERIFRIPVAWCARVVGAMRRKFSLRLRLFRRSSALLKALDQRYEQLVDLLCSAAQTGAAASREARYRELRGWIRSHYPPVRPHLRRFWNEQNCAWAPDPLEHLVSHERLDDAIGASTSIEEMMMCRRALDAYRFTIDAGMLSL